MDNSQGGMQVTTMNTVQKALEAAGVVFIDNRAPSQGGVPGVRLNA